MYCRYAETKRWKVEMMSASETGSGGYKEVIASISGDKVYSRLKYESGAHRVQRVPATESQGRIHTSAVTVAIMSGDSPRQIASRAPTVRDILGKTEGYLAGKGVDSPKLSAQLLLAQALGLDRLGLILAM